MLDLEATTQLDTTAADVLTHLRRELDRREVSLYLARVLHRVEAVLERSGFYDELGHDHTWHSISQCVRAARRHTGLKADKAGDGGADVIEDAAPAEPTVPPAPPPARGVASAGVSNREDEDEAEDDEGEDDDEVVEEDESDDTDSGLYAGGPPIGESKLDNAVNLYLHGIRDGRPREAIEAYSGERYVQHSTGVRDGREGFIEFFEAFIERNPNRYIRVLRAIEDGQHVFLHVFQSLNNGEQQWVTTDFFDTDADDLLVEHWDVIAPYSPTSPFGHTPIDGPTEPTDIGLTEENKALVRNMIEQVLMPGGERARVDDYFSDRCVEHGAERLDGAASIRDFAAKKHKQYVYDEIVLLVGQGSFVATLCKVRRRGEPVAQVDIFRVEYGRIAEHWDNAEVVPPEGDWANSGKF